MKLRSNVGNYAGECAAVSPVDVLEVQLEADIAIFLAGGHEPAGHGFIGSSIHDQFVKIFLRKSMVDDDRHDGDMVLARGFKYQWIRAAGDEAIRINGIPRGNEHVDLVGMGEKRAHGLGIARQVEK